MGASQSLSLTAAAAKSLQSCPTLRLHRWQLTRFPCPWDSPGKNTGVGCHFLPQGMKVKSESEVPQSCPTLNYPMDCSLPGSSFHGIFQAGVLEWGAIAFSGETLLQISRLYVKHYIYLNRKLLIKTKSLGKYVLFSVLFHMFFLTKEIIFTSHT